MRVLNLTGILSLQSDAIFSKFKDAEFLTISPLEDARLDQSAFIKCEVGSQSYVLALIAQKTSKDNDFLSSLDTGFLSGESNVGEEEIEAIGEFLSQCDVVIVDESLIHKHPDARNNENFLAFLQNIYKFKIINLNAKELNLKFEEFTPLKELVIFDGTVIFEHSQNDEFRGGFYFSMAAKIQDGDEVNIKTPTLEIRRKFILDRDIKGTVAILGVSEVINYNYEVAVITKV